MSDPKVNNLKVSQPSLFDAADYLEQLDGDKKEVNKTSPISQRVHVPREMIEKAGEFWRKVYFSVKVEDDHGKERLLNGIEAYDLGDPKTQFDANSDIYISMCNLLCLEGLIMIGDEFPTTEHADLLAGGSDREKAIADFWKTTFAPTAFQADWAWRAVLAILAGDPVAYDTLLVNYRKQLNPL